MKYSLTTQYITDAIKNHIVPTGPIGDVYTFNNTDCDSLFWCLYVMKNGVYMFENCANKNIVTEKTDKINYIEKYVRPNKHLLKPYSFFVQTRVEYNLANDPKLNINTFLTLCVLENINVCIIRADKICMELINTNNNNDNNNNNKEMFIVRINNKSVQLENITNKQSMSSIQSFTSNMYHPVNIETPIRAMSYYTLGELTDICLKIGIPLINKKTKLEMHTELIKFLN